jgi:hypothetical protein
MAAVPGRVYQLFSIEPADRPAKAGSHECQTISRGETLSRGFRLTPSREALGRTAVALAEAGQAEVQHEECSRVPT